MKAKSTLSSYYFSTSLALFLLGACHLAVSSGYSIGATLLLIIGLYSLRHWSTLKPQLSGQDLWMLAALAIFGLNGLFDAVYHQASSSNYDKAARFLLAIPVYFALRQYPPRLSWLWSGLALGAIATSLLAAWQVWGLGYGRAEGYTHPIQFGNLSMLSAFFCLAGLGWAAQLPSRSQRLGWFALLIIGALCGLLGSLLSGSRGGWIGVPFVLLALAKAYHSFFSLRLKVAICAAGLLAVLGLYHTPALNIQPRIHAALHDITQYQQGNSATSVGARFEMWQAALLLAQERPVLGWGKDQMQSAMQALAKQGLVDPVIGEFNHAHNEVLDTLAKRGLVGLLALAALYFIPLRLFARYINHSNLSTRALATAGLILPIAYIDFGLSQSFLTHNSGLMVYAFWLPVLWGCMRNSLSSRTAPVATVPETGAANATRALKPPTTTTANAAEKNLCPR